VIPIRDSIPSRTTPYVTYAIIALNAVAFLLEINLGIMSRHGGQIELFFQRYALIPAHYSNPEIFASLTWTERIVPFFSTMFLHGGLLHFAGNMWTLWIFGDNVEDWLGHFRYALIYLLWGLAAGLMHMAASWGSPVPTIGASGAIAGVMGAYMVLYPRAKVLTLVPIFFFIQFIELPAIMFLGFWFLLQLFQGMAVGAGGVAWWAHIGGFLAGVAVILLLGKPNATDGGGGWGGFGGFGGGGKGTQTKRPTFRPPPGRHGDRVDEYWK